MPIRPGAIQKLVLMISLIVYCITKRLILRNILVIYLGGDRVIGRRYDCQGKYLPDIDWSLTIQVVLIMWLVLNNPIKSVLLCLNSYLI